MRLLDETRHFDRAARRFGTSWWGQTTPAGRRRIQRRQARARAFLAQRRCRRVLEIGCGSGALTQGVADRVRQVYAVDLSEALLAIARQTGMTAQFVRADATRLPFPDRTFDAVLGDGVLHHLALEPALQEIRRVLVPEGGILFFEPNMVNPQIFLERKTPVRRLHQTPDETAFYRWKIEQVLRRLWSTVCVEPFDFLHPALPWLFIRVAEWAGQYLERWPIVRELAGSLCIEAWESQSGKAPCYLGGTLR